jgi:erythromycin esterase-like protein
MIEWIVIGAIGAALAGVLVLFWREFVDWVKVNAQRLSQAVYNGLMGFKTLIKSMSGIWKRVVKYYSRVDTQWIETIATRTVEFSDLPPELQRKLANTSEVDVSEELKLQLER